ncbi:MAG: S8 family peptidase [Myxococcota bacterium]
MRQTWTTAIMLALACAALFWWLMPTSPHREHPTATAPTGPSAPGILVVDLQDGSTETDLAAVSALVGAPLHWVHPLAQDEALAEGQVADLKAALTALQGDPRVEVAEPSMTLTLDPAGAIDVGPFDGAASFPNDPMYGKQWHLRAMGAPAGWSRSPQGEGVVVAVIDTGVTQVEDLKQTQILEGASFVTDVDSAADDQGHGTHVAGTIAQSTNNGVGVAGVAPKATILPVKVLSAQGFGRSPWIAAGIDYAVDEGADVINLSLGGSYSPVIHNAIKKARKKGVIVVAAAGNSGRHGVGYPGALPETIGVSALGPDGGLAPYSSWGKGVDVSAPGGDTRKRDGGVLQNTVGPGGVGEKYAAFQGTSMASPHVAGAAAVLLSTGMAPDVVHATLLTSANGEGYSEKLGHGSLDLAAALGAGVPGSGTGWMRFAVGAFIALIIGRLAGARPRWLAVSAATAAVTAGGLFFLSWLPVGAGWVTTWLSTGFLEWPASLGLPSWVHFPLWASAAAPLLVSGTLGAFRPTRSLAMGFAAGVGAHLFHGAATGSVSPWWLGSTFGVGWLLLNATFCVLLAMALTGTEKLDRQAESAS